MALSWNDIKHRALAFAQRWADAEREASDAKPFWLDFFDVFGISDKRVATFEHAVRRLPGHGARHDGYIDLFWPGMLLVEHKSRGRDLDRAMEQAMGYLDGIADRDLPQLVVVCDFARFRVRHLASGETREFALSDLHHHIRLFGFLAGYKAQTIAPQDPVNIRAAERMGRLHDALHASGYTGHALEVLLVRLLFCLFADDTGIFQPAQAFRAFIEERTQPDGSDLGPWLTRLFQVLNTPEHQRPRTLDEQLVPFPYVNGKLFEEILPVADFDSAMREALLDACALDWSAISPAIFGSLFQSIMDPKARRHLGAHYTAEDNILKLIRPLFLDELWAEFERVKNQRQRLFEFHKKLRALTFLDPACGCGNFLVIAYRELRRLELEVLRASYRSGQQLLDVQQLIRVDVDQFYGIEIEEFPTQIAQVALWLVDHQMNLLVSEEFGQYYARIPLRSAPHIVHGNALRLDWNDVLPAERCRYVLGNPPFVGAKQMDDTQRADARAVFGNLDNAGLLDYVAAWYVRATRYLQQAHAATASATDRPRAAFVSTNSITQGEQVGVLWGWLLAQGVHIHFAHRTFRWSNEARNKAAVHCVIIGFGLDDRADKTLYEYADVAGEPLALRVQHLNPYLVEGPDVLLPRRSRPLCDVPAIGIGNKPIDGGHYLFTPAERDAFIAREPRSARWFRRWLGAEEFLNGTERWCLWLGECPPAALRAMPLVLQRVQAVRAFRLASRSEPTRRLADTPTRFHVENMPDAPYLVIPEVSSERRAFIPIGFEQPDTLCSNLVKIVPHATPYHFGILSSTMHNAWVRAVCGRLKSDFRYSAAIVYNNFPWPDLPADAPASSAAQRARTAIEDAARHVLAVRATHQEGERPASLADLYDPLTMPADLRKAHQRLDAAVDAAYALCGGARTWPHEAERVAFLLARYQQLSAALAVPTDPTPTRPRHRATA